MDKLLCPICEATVEVREFAVNPMFDGGVGYEAVCPSCGLSSGVVYRDRDSAIVGFKAFVAELDELDEEDD